MRLGLVIFFVVISTASFSQGYKRFSVGVGVGAPMGSFSPGAIGYIEPSYLISDKISLGLRGERVSGDLRGVVTLIGSYSLNGQYYFSAEKLRPFAGLGMGVYTPSLSPGTCNCTYSTNSYLFGLYPRVGFYFGHFALLLDYNFISNSQMKLNDQTFGGYSLQDLKPSYFSTKIGVIIGGGKKD